VSRRARIIIAATVVVIVGALVAYNATKDRRNRIQVQTQKVERRDLISTVTASGELKPKRYVNVSSDVPGRITKLFVQEGDRVRAGQPLCTIDATRFAASVRQTEAGLASVRADLRRSEADLAVSGLDLQRTEKMFRDQLVSDQAFDQAQAEIKMKQAAVDSLKKRIVQQEAALEFDRDNLQKTTVAAPMDGVVTLLQKEEGETVIGAQSFQPTVIMVVADLSVMETEILVDETDIRDLKLHQTVEVRVDALQDVKIKGEVTEIGASAIVRGATAGTPTSTNTANQAKDFKVTITLKDPPQEIKPGLNATAEITTASKQKVLAVPIQAVVVREVGPDGKVVDPAMPGQGGGSAGSDNAGGEKRKRGEEKEGVFVVVKEQALFRPVKTGIMGDTELEVLDGLAEGDEIVTGSYKTLRTLQNEARLKIDKPKDKPKDKGSDKPQDKASAAPKGK
jgi:HlyD family secretion protein